MKLSIIPVLSQPNIGLVVLFIVFFWNIFYQILIVIENQVSYLELNNLGFALFSLFFLGFLTFLCYLLLNKKNYRFKFNKPNKSTIEFIIVLIYLSLIIFLTIELAFYNSDESNSSILINFSTILIISLIQLILIESVKIKVFLTLFLTIFWTILFISREDNTDIQIIKRIIKVFTNLSISLISIYTFQIKHIEPEVKNNQNKEKEKKIYKILNLIHAAFLVLDTNFEEVLFANRKLKKFLKVKENITESKLSESFFFKPQSSPGSEILKTIHKINDFKMFEQMKLDDMDEEESFETIQTPKNNSRIFENFEKVIEFLKLTYKDKSSLFYNLLRDKYLIFTYELDGFNKESFYIEMKVSLVDIGEQKGFLLMFIDLTEQKKNVEINTLKQNTNKEIAYIAHEFRTPLNSIIGNLEILNDIEDISVLYKDEFIKPAVISSTLLLNYVNDILDLAQINEHKFKLNFVTFDLVAHIQEVLKLVEVQSLKKGIALKTLFDPLLPNSITSDPNRLTQILLNLLSNAFKFTPKSGKIEIRVSLIESLFKIEIEDDGIGISEDNLQHLFKEFGKINSAKHSLLNPSGVGLGLIISQKLAKGLGPEGCNGFEVRSKIGKGTVFAFFLEDKIKDDETAFIKVSSQKRSIINKSTISEKQEDSELDNIKIKNKNFSLLQTNLTDNIGGLLNNTYSERNNNQLAVSTSNNRQRLSSANLTMQISYPSPNSSPKTNNAIPKFCSSQTIKGFPYILFQCECPKILIVDDDMFCLNLMTNILKILGFSSETSFNGEEAINKIKEREENKCCNKCVNFRIIFMDSEMPKLNGIETTKNIVQILKNNSSRIIGCSGNSSENFIQSFKEAGAEIVLIKPITKKIIAKIVSNLI